MKIDPRITLALIFALFLETAGGLIWAGARRLMKSSAPWRPSRRWPNASRGLKCKSPMRANHWRGSKESRRMIVEGYAALFGVADQMQDVGAGGAFAASLVRPARPCLCWLSMNRAGRRHLDRCSRRWPRSLPVWRDT